MNFWDWLEYFGRQENFGRTWEIWDLRDFYNIKQTFQYSCSGVLNNTTYLQLNCVENPWLHNQPSVCHAHNMTRVAALNRCLLTISKIKPKSLQNWGSFRISPCFHKKISHVQKISHLKNSPIWKTLITISPFFKKSLRIVISFKFEKSPSTS